METAPKDGTVLLAYHENYPTLCDIIKWDRGEWTSEFGNGDMTHWRPLSIANIANETEQALARLVRLLLDAGLKHHARNLKYDREGYSGPAWHPSESCSGTPAVCAKWVTKQWQEVIDESIKCNCGADEHNQRLQDAARALVAFIPQNAPALAQSGGEKTPTKEKTNE